jgi:hypothetical protein
VLLNLQKVGIRLDHKLFQQSLLGLLKNTSHPDLMKAAEMSPLFHVSQSAAIPIYSSGSHGLS